MNRKPTWNLPENVNLPENQQKWLYSGNLTHPKHSCNIVIFLKLSIDIQRIFIIAWMTIFGFVVLYSNEAIKCLKSPVFFIARFSLLLSRVHTSAKTGYSLYYYAQYFKLVTVLYRFSQRITHMGSLDFVIVIYLCFAMRLFILYPWAARH